MKRFLIFLSILIVVYFSIIDYFHTFDTIVEVDSDSIKDTKVKRSIASDNWTYEIYNNGKKEKNQVENNYKNKEKLIRKKISPINLKKEAKKKWHQKISLSYNKKSRLIKAQNDLGSGEINSPFYDSYNFEYSLSRKKYYYLLGIGFDNYQLNNTKNNDFFKTNLQLLSYKFETGYSLNENNLLGINIFNEDISVHKVNSNYKFILYKENITHIGIFYMYKKRLTNLEVLAKFAYNKSVVKNKVSLDRKEMQLKTKFINKTINPYVNFSYLNDVVETEYYNSEENGLLVGAGIEINF